MASLNVTHTGDRLVFTFSVGVDEIDLSGFQAGQQVSASTEPTPGQQPAPAEGEDGSEPTPTPPQA